jgi:cytochrome c oxidase accessory protein FixG
MSQSAVPPVQEVKLYARHVKLYPKAARGWFTSWRWAMVWFTQLLYYGTAWLEWNGRQAVLFHLAERKFYIFGLVLWPQDFIYLTGLLIISACALFLFTAVAGRLFCGYACPQTVYAEIFMGIEKLIEGDRVRRMKLDQAPNSPKKLALKTLKLGLWSVIALWTGFTFVGYFTPIRELSAEVLALTVSGWSLFWMLFYAGFTLLQAGFMREQVCKYMCPYARFQSSMFDKDTMIVTYDTKRGEPRGARAKKSDAKAQGVGDCVDCGICVHVCPTGIDIRQGLQYECIGCGACIDGCDTMMDKMGYARGLIRYSTEHAMQQHWSKKEIWAQVFRWRTLLYATILLMISSLWAAALYWRSHCESGRHS